MKKIQFNKAFDYSGITDNQPSPASKAVPKWFKDLGKYHGSSFPKFEGDGSLNLTVKSCPPFLDSMIAGYTVYTEFDMNVSRLEGEAYFEWAAGGDLVSNHDTKQISEMQVPEGFDKTPFKFNNLWQIKTPPGHSCLFTHPVNRTDLPFMTMSGTVETDTYSGIINFPFFLKTSFEGIIPAGTPMAQIFPFKRESWEMSMGEVSQKELEYSAIKLKHRFINSYKTQWWRRKEYR